MVTTEVYKKQTSFDKDTADSYFWPDSFERLYSYSDLEGLSSEQVDMIRAEIYARAGMIFNEKKYQEYFSRKSWYSAKIEESRFNKNKHLGYYAIENLRMIETFLKGKKDGRQEKRCEKYNKSFCLYISHSIAFRISNTSGSRSCSAIFAWEIIQI